LKRVDVVDAADGRLFKKKRITFTNEGNVDWLKRMSIVILTLPINGDSGGHCR
jgi:hypothetical protein